eukprot:TRINITY_DN886_c0_g1_i1.p1 TRINITY_DN886_c0_g1~~TRINITY_DN886_c0_g1_i1.p1  ORF type:complete len:864 (+),score=102.19 TRINITY_DN886_c0_g1_i1:4700-7291(+)
MHYIQLIHISIESTIDNNKLQTQILKMQESPNEEPEIEMEEENLPEEQEEAKHNPKTRTAEILSLEARDTSKDMNVEDDDENNRPKPKIQTLRKNQPSFAPITSSQSQPTKKERLRSLFLKYAEVSAETGIPSLKPRQFLKLFQDARLLDSGTGSKLTKPKAEIIYSSHTKSKRGFMGFETFLTCLVKVAETVNPDLAQEKRSRAVEHLISQWLLPLQEIQSSRSAELSYAAQAKSIESLSGISYDAASKELLMSVLPMLKDVYDVYFGNAFKVAKDYKQIAQIATKQLLIFLREFDLTKNFTQKPLALVILEQLVHTPDDRLTNSSEVPAVFGEVGQDYGCYFTLSRFFIFLLWVAVSGFDSTRSDASQYTNAEKVFFLLAKMELSNGFLTLYKNVPKSLSTQHTLIPPAHILSRTVQNNPLSPEPKYKESEEEKVLVGEHEEEQERIAIEMCTDKLQRLFMLYCGVNDNSNTNKMPLFKFMMFLKDAGILGQVSTIDAELVFSKVIGLLNDKRLELEKEGTASPLKNAKVARMYADDVAKRAKMDFKAFYYAITIIAKKMYPDLSTNKALVVLTEKNIKALEERNSKVEKNSELLRGMFEALREDKVVELLTWVHKLVKVYFDAYTDNTGVMGYETFVKFCRDFGIFPDLCSKLVLHSTFYALAFVNSRIIEGTNPSNCFANNFFLDSLSQASQMSVTSVDRAAIRRGEYLDENLFVEALALCALRSKAFDRDNGNIERILHLMEKIAQSQGIAKVKKMMGKTRISAGDIDPLINLRQKYSEYFDKKFASSNPEDVLDEALGEEEPEGEIQFIDPHTYVFLLCSCIFLTVICYLHAQFIVHNITHFLQIISAFQEPEQQCY